MGSPLLLWAIAFQQARSITHATTNIGRTNNKAGREGSSLSSVCQDDRLTFSLNHSRIVSNATAPIATSMNCSNSVRFQLFSITAVDAYGTGRPLDGEMLNAGYLPSTLCPHRSGATANQRMTSFNEFETPPCPEILLTDETVAIGSVAGGFPMVSMSSTNSISTWQATAEAPSIQPDQ